MQPYRCSHRQLHQQKLQRLENKKWKFLATGGLFLCTLFLLRLTFSHAYLMGSVYYVRSPIWTAITWNCTDLIDMPNDIIAHYWTQTMGYVHYVGSANMDGRSSAELHTELSMYLMTLLLANGRLGVV
ncbi:hypothetical protein CDAR_109021 [Caerostris darwini]|uniref:Uncharacterized protein n=1 Tax=Caerostris darwini TaxID=1538125 RepID=A0AAV4VEM6_9ARAC|nr:hypothetical protein CDAR_109021 [Caerostris darwini]